jgi:hypothetical protein
MTRLFTEVAVLLRVVELSSSFTASSQSFVCPSWLPGSWFWKVVRKSYCASLIGKYVNKICKKITPTKKCLVRFALCRELWYTTSGLSEPSFFFFGTQPGFRHRYTLVFLPGTSPTHVKNSVGIANLFTGLELVLQIQIKSKSNKINLMVRWEIFT